MNRIGNVAKAGIPLVKPADSEESARQVERLKAQVRAPVEHPFCQRPPALPLGQRLRPLAISLRSVHVLKDLFRHRKTRDRGLAKHTAQLHSLFALVNLLLARRPLLVTAGR